MAYTDIDKPSDYFETILWSAVDTSITGLDFQPDWVWIKSRTNADTQVLFDAVRGTGKRLSSSGTTAEQTKTDELTAFNSDGFTIGTGDNVNRSGHNYVSWNWKAGGSASSNSDGSITSSVSVSTDAGFSIVQWSGNGSGGASVGHGLGVAPDVIIKKRTDDGSGAWYLYNKVLGNTKSIYLNYNFAVATSGAWNNQTPSSTVFYNGSGSAENGGTMISYCFASKKGFSKFGSYTGNGNADGTFVYTGQKSAFIMIKQTNASGEDWFICDTKREGYNAENNRLLPNLNSAESTDSPIDILSNGFKARQSGAAVNGSGASYIYMAFAENPFVTSTGVPTTAR